LNRFDPVAGPSTHYDAERSGERLHQDIREAAEMSARYAWGLSGSIREPGKCRTIPTRTGCRQLQISNDRAQCRNSRRGVDL
jgi:hypothetical protein